MSLSRKIDPNNDYNGFERQLVTFETVPSKDAGLIPSIHENDLSVKSKFNEISLELITDDIGRDIIGLAVNPNYVQKTESHFGTFEGVGSPTNIFQMAESFDKESLASDNEMDCYCAVIGIVFEQDAVPYMKAEKHDDYKNKDLHFGLQLSFEHPIDEDRFKILDRLFSDYAAGVEFTVLSDRSIRAVNFRDDGGIPYEMSDVQFIQKVIKAAEKFPTDEAISIQRMKVSGNYIFNDWSKNPDGGNYVQLLKDNGRHDLVELAEDLRSMFLSKVSEFAQEMGVPEKTKERHDLDAVEFTM
jgi:hypothetical protein